MTIPKIVTNGWASTIRIGIQMLGHTGLIVLCIIILIYVTSGGRLPGQTGPSATDVTAQILKNQTQVIENQHLIIALLDENQKTTYRQSIILENIAHVVERMEDRK